MIAAVLLNPGAIVWDPDLRSRRDARLLSNAILSGDSWRRLFQGDVDLRRKASFLGTLFRSFLGRARRALRRSSGGSANDLDPARVLERVAGADKRIALAFCENEPVLAELRADGVIRTIAGWPNIELDYLEGEDHAIGPIGAQRQAAGIIDRELALAVKDETSVAEPQRS